MYTSPSPKRFDKHEYDNTPERKEKRRLYRRSDAGKQAEKKYRHDNSKHTTDAAYLSKEIVAVDGEGINMPDGSHRYILLAISNVRPISNPGSAFREPGLSTTEILEYLWTNLSTKNINVIYGGSYDFNMWIRGTDEFNYEKISRTRAVYNSNYTSGFVNFGEYGVRWIKGKGFEISHRNIVVKINDVISFFQCPFIKACDDYLSEWSGYGEHEREILVREKARRGNFTADELAGITDYNNLELLLIVRLVSELRERLNRVGLRPRRWDGPGAIAAALFLREGVKKHRDEHIPEPVARAARFAYAGGRFEMLKYGSVVGTVYEYDINSAYPAALSNVPSLVGGRWIHHVKRSDRAFPFALYKVRFSGTHQTIPGPLFCRAPNGTVSYPLNVETWIWSPEMEVLREYVELVGDCTYEVIECWEYREAPQHIRPFGFIPELYEKRQKLKAAKDGAHVGIKLGLNSLYGKLAQQVGWIPASKNFPVRIPTYHQLEWAGYATSWCRANVLRAVLPYLDSVIAFETDAVFTTVPLPHITVGAGLGEWEVTEFKSLTYVQSGHYYGTKTNGEEVVKCRGIDRDFISREAIENALAVPESERIYPAKLTRFYGAGIALARGLETWWCRWITEPKYLFLGPSGKRAHGACWCNRNEALVIGEWHNTFCPVYGGISAEYPVEWINPNPEMREAITEEREKEYDYED